jgi:hypothetical protein
MALAVRKYNKDTSTTLKVNSSVTILEGQLVGVNSSGEAVLADKDAGDGPVFALGFAVRDAAGASGDYVTIASQGIVDGFTSLTPGARQFASGTAGGVTATRPTGAGDAIQAIGLAVASTKIAMNVAQPNVLAQAAGTSTVT